VAEGFAAQAEAAWRNLMAVLADTGMRASDLVQVTHYLLSRDDLAAYNAVRMHWLGAARPASTLVLVASLAKPEWRIKVEAVAWRA